MRWLVLGERRLALKRIEQKQESADEQREDVTRRSAAPEPEPEEITVAASATQTRRLLRALTTIAVLIAHARGSGPTSLPAIRRCSTTFRSGRRGT